MKIQLFQPHYEVDECLAEIRECLETGWTGIGKKTLYFERAWCEYTSLPHAHFLNSATAGLNLALAIWKITERWSDQDEVITTPITFVSTNHAILLNGLKPVFADVDEYLCINPDSLEGRITKKTRAVIYVGMGGNTGQYQRIVEICKAHRIKLLIDAAHMAGTRLNGQIPGQEADAMVYSFHAVKNLPIADGGMLCFQEESLDRMSRKLSWLGIDKDTYRRTESPVGYQWKYDVEHVGYKYHGNSILAAIGLVQLRYLDRDNRKRRALGEQYRSFLHPHQEKLQMIPIPPGCESSSHLFQVLVPDRDFVMKCMDNAGIHTGVHYQDNTSYRMYREQHEDCPYAAYVSEHVLSLPMHLFLTDDNIQYISSVLAGCL